MKQQIASTLFHASVAACLLSAAVSAQAATSWNLAGCSLGTADVVGFRTCNDVDVRATSTNTGPVTNATVTSWSTGLGVRNSVESDTDGPHSLDNYNGLDALIFRFQDAVSLTSLTVGWNGSDNATGRYNDSDAAVYAWTGIGTPGNVTSGWTLIDKYLDMGDKTGNTATTAATTATYSSYWLVSAWGTGGSSSSAFKVFSIAGNIAPPTTGVPEPGSLALMAMGAFGLMAARRRQKNQAI